jgi:hypothetical protein
VLEVNLWKLMVFLFRDTLRYYLRYKIHLLIYRTKVIIRRLFVTATFCSSFSTASFRANQNEEILDQILTFATGATLQLHSYYSIIQECRYRHVRDGRIAITLFRDHCRIVWNVDDWRGGFTGDWSGVDGFVQLFPRDHAKNGYSTASAIFVD